MRAMSWNVVRSAHLFALLLGCSEPATDPDAGFDGGSDAGPPDAGPPPDPLAGRGEVMRVASGFSFTEGPQWREGMLLFTDIPPSTIHAFVPPGPPTVFRMPSDEANGLGLLPDGRLIAAEHLSRRVSVTAADGTVTALVDRFEGMRFHSPNDLVARSDGTVYFTDPPYGLRGAPELDFVGVFRVNGSTIDTVWRGPLNGTPNGIALSPDETILYVAFTEEGLVRAYDVAPDGTTSGERVFTADVSNADGMAVDEHGNVYVAMFDGIAVHAPDGSRWGVIPTDMIPTNCAFGGDDLQTLYITAGSIVYSVRLAVRGLP